MDADTMRFRVLQDGMEVAGVEGPALSAMRQAAHYLAVYGQDGPATLQWRKGRRWMDARDGELENAIAFREQRALKEERSMTQPIHPMHPAIVVPIAGREQSLFTDADRLVLALALDALDRSLVCWINDTKLTDEEGKMFTAALMAANRIVNADISPLIGEGE